jgi:hypothetical protein
MQAANSRSQKKQEEKSEIDEHGKLAHSAYRDTTNWNLQLTLVQARSTPFLGTSPYCCAQVAY